MKNQNIVTINAYAPIVNAEDGVKNFYSQVEDILSSVPNNDKIIILGDLNARVGKGHRLWTGMIIKEAAGKVNANEIFFLNKCAEHNLVIINTLFHQKKGTKSPGSIHAPNTGTSLVTASYNLETNKMC